ncbi:RluA family pseudouridine synthase [Candidatus Uhrbacteria bacterium]|nr:RluA family pseudouridine synthase [Candidatus Uhrbacteria bacterium]
MPTFIIDETHSGQRLDVAVTALCDLTRGQVQKLIKTRDILVNGKPADRDTRVQGGEKIFVPPVETGAPPARKGDIPLLQIVYENPDVLIINKPAGLIVHGYEGAPDTPTLVDALLEMRPEIADVGENPIRPGIVHRLDKDVSGLMVIAKTQEAHQFLKAQFQNRTVYKEYLALVYGSLPKDHDVITLKIARSKARGRMVARPSSQEGKEALTEYDVVKRYKNHTYIRVILHTGRTHQIRVHLRAIDYPIVGDTLYKKTRMKHIRPIEMNRVFLHAHKLRIRLMDGTEKTFVEPLPNELKKILTTLK